MKRAEIPEPRSWGLTETGHRYATFYGIFCEVCTEDITDIHKPRTALVCEICADIDYDACNTLHDCLKQPDLSIEAKRVLRHAAIYLSDRFKYEDYMVDALNSVELSRSALLRHIKQDNEARRKLRLRRKVPVRV